jgi:hypothetical protein
LRNLNVTAEQRRQAAAAISDFHEKRTAIEKLGQTDEFLKALATVRQTLLEGKAPTDEMREAVEVAQPPDDGTVDRAFMDARREVVEKLVGLLTEPQTEQLRMMPLVEFANHIVGMSLEAREMGDEEFGDWRRMVAMEAAERFGVAGNEEADAMDEVIQDAIGRLRAMEPDAIAAERDQLVSKLVSALNDALPESPQAAWDRLADQLWEWVMNPRVATVLQESAAAMGAP